ncbi:MAG: DUF4349 domain-containing protein [Flavobacteriaceae bacterium]
MKHLSKISLALLLLGFAFSCKQVNYEDTGENSTDKIVATDSTATVPLSSKAAVEPKNRNRKFVRTADVKFRVKDVAKSTYAIEDAISRNGGFVTFTDLKSTINERDEKQINQDSIVETTKFTVENTITFRAPNNKLDTILKSMAKEVDFLDTRNIKAEDVTMQFLANNMSQKRIQKHTKRLENDIDNKGKKLDQINDSENDILEKETESDNAALNSLSLEDRTAFSTVTLFLYQRESIKSVVLVNPKNIDSYRPNIGLQIVESLKSGWLVLEAIIVFIVKIWWLILFVTIGIFIYKKYARKTIHN